MKLISCFVFALITFFNALNQNLLAQSEESSPDNYCAGCDYSIASDSLYIKIGHGSFFIDTLLNAFGGDLHLNINGHVSNADDDCKISTSFCDNRHCWGQLDYVTQLFPQDVVLSAQPTLTLPVAGGVQTIRGSDLLDPDFLTLQNYSQDCGDTTVVDRFVIIRHKDPNGLFVSKRIHIYIDIICSECGTYSTNESKSERSNNKMIMNFSGPNLAKHASTNVLVIHPNPADTKLNLVFQSDVLEKRNIAITNALGQKVYQKNNILVVGETQLNIDVTNFKEGIYFLMITNEEGIVVNQNKLLVKH